MCDACLFVYVCMHMHVVARDWYQCHFQWLPTFVLETEVLAHFAVLDDQ